MGIVNASPESFSDGERVGGLEAQVERALRLRAEGASIIDVGGESGVSDRPAVGEQEEIDRVVPLIERLAPEGVEVSVDTLNPTVARAAVASGPEPGHPRSGLSHP